MARARAKPNRRLSDISEVILAEWYRVLPATAGPSPLQMDVFALTAAFNDILDVECQAVLDEEGQPIKIVVPLPPVASRLELDTYVAFNTDFRVGMGAAVIFGCGR